MVGVVMCVMVLWFIRAGQASQFTCQSSGICQSKVVFFKGFHLVSKICKNKKKQKQVQQQDYHMIISSDFALWWQHLAWGLESGLQHMNSYDLMQEFGKHVQQQFLAGLANFYFFGPWQQLWPLRSVLGLVIWPGGLGLGLTSSDLIQELRSL